MGANLENTSSNYYFAVVGILIRTNIVWCYCRGSTCRSSSGADISTQAPAGGEVVAHNTSTVRQTEAEDIYAAVSLTIDSNRLRELHR